MYAKQARLFDLDVQPYRPGSLDTSLLWKSLLLRQDASPHAPRAQSLVWNGLREQLTSLRQAAVAVMLAGVLVAGKYTSQASLICWWRVAACMGTS